MANAPERVFAEYLVVLAQAGEPRAFARLVAHWQPRLLAHAARLSGRADAARDAVQDAWLAIARGIARLDDPARFGVWAYRIVTRKCADAMRGEIRARRTNAAFAAEPTGVPPPAPDAEILAGDAAVALRRALAALSPDHRAVLGLFYADEMSVGDIASVLGIPPGTVKSRLFHARNHLKHALERSSS